MNKIKFFLKNRFILFIVSILLFIGLNYFFTGQLLPNANTKNIWFFSGLFMVLFSTLYIEPFYTSPKNVITNSIPLFLVYISIKQSFKNITIWWFTIGLVSILIFISILAMALSKKDESLDSSRNRIANKLKSVAIFFGKGKVLYSIVFLSTIFLYKSEQIENFSDTYFFLLIILWGFILLINTASIHSNFSSENNKKDTDAIGEIFSVQSNKMFLVRIFDDKKNIKKFDIVKFKYQMSTNPKVINQGFVFDTYNLNQQKWAKIFLLNQLIENKVKLKNNTVYKVTCKLEKEQLSNELRVDSFVGVVIEGSKIGSIKFEYSKKTNNLEEGNLLELKVSDNRIFYQVIGGLTESEKLEQKDESGFIEGEAIQLGIWNNKTTSFEKYGWVPEINTALFIADTENILVQKLLKSEFKLGNIPNTNLPSILNLNETLSHHIALLGVTGSGKSFLAMEMIKQLQKNTKVICIDFTGEWAEKLKKFKPVNIIKPEGLAKVEEKIAKKEDLASQRGSNKEILLKYRNEIREILQRHVSKFLNKKENGNLAIFEIPDLSNTTFILEFTQFFIESVFKYAKGNSGSKVLLVLEEAHTIVPETNFLGDLGDYGSSKALVSKMSQIALQGRKYGVGLMVIAQRTANVSKTILTQCNTIICFQAFDETSFTFLGNYIGKDLIKELPNLKKYHAIVTGKAIKSKIPMIVNLERKRDE